MKALLCALGLLVLTGPVAKDDVEETTYCTMIVGMAWNPQTGQCEEFRDGCRRAALLRAGYRIVPDGATCNEVTRSEDHPER